MSRLRTILAVCSCAMLIVPAAAAARPGQRSVTQTFPVASRLCANIAAGRGPAKLRPDAAQVAALCATLHSSFTTAQNAYFATTNPIRLQADALVLQTRQTCATSPGPVCRQARAAARVTLAGLRSQVRAAAVTYRTSIKAARSTFWAAIHGLRGASRITADSGTPVAPAITIPTTA